MNDAEEQGAVLIEAELRAMAEALRAGGDVAPARRARLEGLLEFVVRADPENAARLCEKANTLLGDCGEVRIGQDGRAVWLALWQRRAPVWPTTTD